MYLKTTKKDLNSLNNVLFGFFMEVELHYQLVLLVIETVQNDLIHCCSEEIANIIVDGVKSSGLYSILFDEATDISHKSQVNLILKYSHDSREIREDFVGFMDAFHDVRTATTDSREEIMSYKEDAQITKTASAKEKRSIL